jgi:hypothetical protein
VEEGRRGRGRLGRRRFVVGLQEVFVLEGLLGVLLLLLGIILLLLLLLLLGMIMLLIMLLLLLLLLLLGLVY